MPTIISVEDDLMYQTFIKAKLTKLYPNEDVHYSTTGQECIDTIDQDTVLVLVDFMLDDMSGLEVAKAIKSINSEIEIIFLTNTPFKEVEVEACKLGVVDFINKNDVASTVAEGFYPLKKSIDLVLKVSTLRKQFNLKLTEMSERLSLLEAKRNPKG